MNDLTKCTVRDGMFVEPCMTLEDAVDNNAPGFSRAKGVFCQVLTNRNTHQPSRTYFGLKSKKFPSGILLNHCPWCGVDISAPFTDGDSGAND